MPSRTGATPIIWGNSIFLNVAEGDDLYLWRVDKTKGTAIWKKQIASGNYKINKQNMSSPSPVTDGQGVYAMTGIGVLKGFDFDGNELWMREIQKDYGKFGLNWGYASSPLLYEDSLYVQVLHGMKTHDPSYILRIDKKTGKTIWRVVRPTDAIRESPDSYTTPALLKYADHVEIVITGGDAVTGHDPATGEEIWRGKGFNPDKDPNYRIIASPVVFDGVIYAPTRVKPLIAFRAGGRGDISESHKLWSFVNGPDVPTPVTDGKYFYSVERQGHPVVPGREDRPGDLGRAAHQVGDLQLVAGAGGREDLHQQRGRPDDGDQGRAEVRSAGGERSERLHAEFAGDFRRAHLSCALRSSCIRSGSSYLLSQYCRWPA